MNQPRGETINMRKIDDLIVSYIVDGWMEFRNALILLLGSGTKSQW